MKKITSEIERFIIDHHKGVGCKKMAELVNETFGISISATPVKNVYRKNGLKSGVDGRFKPGHPSDRKGMKWADYMSPEGQAASRTTWFKPGHIPHNGGIPVGTLRLRKAVRNKPGSKPYYWQKIAQPNVWKLKQRIEWEEHYGPIPEGYCIEFADGNTLNWHIDNLVLMTRAQHGMKNRMGLKSHNKESAETCRLIVDMKSVIAMKRSDQDKKKE